MHVAGFLAVIMFDGEINRFHPLVIIRIDAMQKARFSREATPR